MLVIGSDLNTYQLGGLALLGLVYVIQINKVCAKIKAEEEKKAKAAKEEEEKLTAINEEDKIDNKSSQMV